MFTDDYFDKEDNSKIFDFFIKFFLTNEVELDFNQNEAPAKYSYIPDIEEMAEKLKCCL